MQTSTIFCLQTAKTHEGYDPLTASQWIFCVAPRAVIEARASVSMGLSTLTRIAASPWATPIFALQALPHPKSVGCHDRAADPTAA